MNVLPSSPVELCRAWIEPGLPSVNLDETLTMNARLQSAILANVPDVAGVVARTGSDELGPDPMGPNQTDTFLVLKPADQRHTMDKPALMQQLRQILGQFPGFSFSFTQPIDMRVQETACHVYTSWATLQTMWSKQLRATAAHRQCGLRGRLLSGWRVPGR